jgi:hypothetical protein
LILKRSPSAGSSLIGVTSVAGLDVAVDDALPKVLLPRRPA